MVSLAHRHRYFPASVALLIEAPLDGIMPTPSVSSAAATRQPRDNQDPPRRVDRAGRRSDACYRNGSQLRLMLAAGLERAARRWRARTVGEKAERTDSRYVRTGARRSSRARPRARHCRHLSQKACSRLCALALVFGTESMIVFGDVLGLDERPPEGVKAGPSALVAAALAESTPRGRDDLAGQVNRIALSDVPTALRRLLRVGLLFPAAARVGASMNGWSSPAAPARSPWTRTRCGGL